MGTSTRTPRPPTPLGPAGEALRQNLKRIRSEERRLTFVELSKRLDALGRPIPVLGLRRIEAGERRVDVDDLMALAEALGTPPVLLIVPLGHASVSEVLPGRKEHPWDASNWVTGRDRDPWTDWRQSTVATQLFEAHDDALLAWGKAVEFAAEAVKEGFPRELTLERMEARQEEAAKSLVIVRANMRAQGLLPPPLPTEVAHLDPEGAEPPPASEEQDPEDGE